MMKKGVFFVSNGYGEDSIAISIVQSIADKSPETSIYALPLVGAGKSYETVPCEIVGPRTVMPSGGVIPGNMPNLIKDAKSGLLSLTFKQLKIMSEISAKSFVTVAVGDIYPTILAALSVSSPTLMIATAKSNYVSPHNFFERFLMRWICSYVFARDEVTAENLRQSKVRALWVGNAMMDCLSPIGFDFNLTSDTSLIALFPGSRQTAFEDFPVILGAVELLDRDFEAPLSFACAIAPSIDLKELTNSLRPLGWTFAIGEELPGGRVDYLKKGNITIYLLKGAVGDILKECKLVIGQAGTANEQAVGLGKPVVTFDSYSQGKMGWYRMRQKCLLGDSISVVEKDSIKIAKEASNILTDRKLYEKMTKIGFERMGPSGGADKMADYILSFAPNDGI